MLEQYPVSDLLIWMDERTLVLNAEFQRRAVWQPPAKAYLIDTILRERPMPNIYLRTKTNLRTRRAYREVVDGQQRLRAIREFANGEFALGKIAGEFAGMRYADLDPESQANFLSYRIGVVQLSNASDAEVLDVFQRINAHGLSLNRQELRHGKYQGEFRNTVIDSAKRWAVLWDRYRVVSLREWVRMADHELTAQMLGLILEGVQDGGQPAIEKLYGKYDEHTPKGAARKLDRVVQRILEDLPLIVDTPLVRSPHFLMLFAAVAHALHGLPEGAIGSAEMPVRDGAALYDLAMARANLGVLSDVIQMDDREVPERFFPFKYAAAGTTQRIRSRKARFLALYQALLPEPL